SRKRTLEVVVRGREGVLTVDMGQISEDISISGINNAKPDGRLQSEIEVGVEIINNNDAGLDGKKGAAETGVIWECKPTCYSIPVTNDLDPGRDDWVEPERGSTVEPYKVNGTEGNSRGTSGYAY